MIWITTLLMLAIAALFIRQGLYEKRLYLEQNEDPAAAAEEGLFMDAVKKVAPAKGDEPPLLEEEDTLFARATRRVQGFDSPVNRLMDKKSEQASAAGEDRFDRIAKTVRKRLDDADAKLGKQLEKGNENTSDGDLLTRMGERITRAETSLDERIARRAERPIERRPVNENKPANNAARTDDWLSRQAGKIAGVGEDGEDWLSRRASKIAGVGEDGEDWLSRQAAKIGSKVDAIDERMVNGTRRISDKLSRNDSSS